jgi:ABC-type lipoprotein export system ATPase subunit
MPMGTEQLLRVEDVTTSFGKRKILDSITFDVPEGKFVTITGKSGVGKSTLLGIISGLLEPDKGRVIYNGQNIFHWSDYKRSRFRNREIGFVFQFFNLLPDMTSYHNIIYPAVINPKTKNIRKEVDYLVEYLHLEQIIDQYPATLSGGERQRVAIARAIINNPKMILADEPTGNLDEITSGEIINLFRSLVEKRNMSIIVVTHDKRIVQMADVNLHIDEGEIENKTKQEKPAPRVRKKR